MQEGLLGEVSHVTEVANKILGILRVCSKIELLCYSQKVQKLKNMQEQFKNLRGLQFKLKFYYACWQEKFHYM